MTNQIFIKNNIKPYNKILKIEGDKSLSIRWALLASQAFGKSTSTNLLKSEDVMSTLQCLKKLGVKIKTYKDKCEINGVGLQLGARNEDGEIVVICPLEDSPAADAGIMSGSILLKVNNESPKRLGLEATAAKLRGETGSQVVVELQPPNEGFKEVTLERRSVDLRPVRTRRLRDETHTLGY